MLHIVFLLAVTAAALEPVRIQLSTEPSTLDAPLCDDLYCYQILVHTNRTLMRTDADGKLVDYLAHSHSISKDGLTYRFKMVEDAKWSDGKPIRAEEVVAGILHALDPKTAAPDANFIYSIKGGRAFGSGKGPREAVAIRVDKGDVTIELEHPDVGFLGALTIPMTAPRRSDFSKWEVGQPSSGRYVVKKWKREGELLLEPNPAFSEPGQLPLLFVYVPEEAAAQNLFEAGKLDVMSKFATSETAAYRARGLAHVFPLWALGYIILNPAKPPLDDVDIRRAIIGAVRRDEIGKLLPDDYEAGVSVVPSRLNDHVAPKADFSAAIAKVRALAAKPRIKLSYTRMSLTDILMQKVQADLRKYLGLEVELDGSEWKSLFGRVRNDPPQMFFMGSSAMFNTPLVHLRILTRDPAAPADKKVVYANTEYEALVDRVERTSDDRARKALIERALKIVQERDAVILPLAENKRTIIVAKSIKGLRVSPASQTQWQDVRR